MATQQHFTLYTAHGVAPNGWKAMIVLEELGLDYESIYFDLRDGTHKEEAHVKLNPNGRIPTLVDHKNNDFTIWESDAIITYLTEKYDPEHKISFEKFEDTMKFTQWLFFQASGQGAYFGQAGWFTFFHPEKLPSAIVRYQKEILRALGVLDSVLSKQPWLVGDKCSGADLSFIPWNHVVTHHVNQLIKDFEGFNFEKDFPAVHKWHNEMLKRPAVSKVCAIWQDSLSRFPIGGSQQ